LLLKLRERNEEAKEHLWAVREGGLLPLSLYNLGEISLKEGDFPRAEELFYSALDKRWDDIRARDMLAIALRKQGKKQLAREILRLSLELDPLDSLALFEIYLLEGEEEFRNRLRRDDGLPTLLSSGEIGITQDAYLSEADDYLYLARIYISAALWEEGIEVLEEYMKDREKVYPLIYYYLGFIWDKKGEEDKAREAFASGAREAPDFVFPNELESLDVLDTALRYNPQDGCALYYKGNLLYALRRENEALEAWERAKEKEQFPALYRNLALGNRMVEGNYEKAREYYGRAIELEKNWRLFLELDRLLGERKETKKRLELLLSAPQQVRDKSQVAARLAEVYLELGDYEETIELLLNHTFRPWEGEVRMREIYYRAYIERGKKLFGEGRYEEAAESFRRALEYPRNIGVGKPYHTRDEEAKEWLEKTLAELNKPK